MFEITVPYVCNHCFFDPSSIILLMNDIDLEVFAPKRGTSESLGPQQHKESLLYVCNFLRSADRT